MLTVNVSWPSGQYWSYVPKSTAHKHDKRSFHKLICCLNIPLARGQWHCPLST